MEPVGYPPGNPLTQRYVPTGCRSYEDRVEIDPQAEGLMGALVLLHDLAGITGLGLQSAVMLGGTLGRIGR